MYNYLTLTRIAGGFLFRSAHISVGKYSLDLNRLKPINEKTRRRGGFFTLLSHFFHIVTVSHFRSEACKPPGISLLFCQ